MTINDNDLCVCGYAYERHFKGIATGKYFCEICNIIAIGPSYHDFKLDNLRYLEEKSR